MKPILFSADETDFTTNGLGRLDCISCNVVEERNGMYELEAEIPVTSPHANEIQQLSIIGAIPYEGSNVQAFVVYKISKPINGRFRVYARHLSYRLTDIPCKPFSIAASPQACAQTLAGLKSNAAESCPFNFTTDVTTGNPYVQKTPASIRKQLGGVEGSVIDQFGGEFKWDNFNVSLLKQRGRLANVTGITLRYGKNITDINQEEEIANTATGVFPFWIDTDGNNLVMIPSPDTIIYSPNAENYPYHLTQILDLSSNFREQPTAAQLKSVAQVYVNKSDFGVPKISIKVSFVDLWKSEEYKNIAPLERVQLCDEITVDFEKLGIKALAKVVKTDYDVLKERYNSIEVGSVRTTLAQAVTDRETSIDTAFIDQFTRINGAIADATAWLTSANGYVVAVKNQDGSWKELLFMNTNNPQTATAGIRINENGIGFFSKTLTPSGDVLSGPYSMAWTMDGRLGDFANKNFWNFFTGNFSLSSSTTVGGQTVQQIADAAQAAAEATAAENLATAVRSIDGDIEDLQNQIDGNITTWYYDYVPTLNNVPASTWTTDEDKNNHIGDLFYQDSTGYAWRFMLDNTVTPAVYKWIRITDEDIAAALAAAQTAQDTADHKRRVFITQPVPPYDEGDLWCVGPAGDILTCVTAKTTEQAYAVADWVKKNKYTDDSAVTDLDNRLTQEEVYNRLTNNGQAKGLFLTGHDLYFNATYINTGSMSADLINTGNLFVGREDNGFFAACFASNVTKTSDEGTFINLNQLCQSEGEGTFVVMVNVTFVEDDATGYYTVYKNNTEQSEVRQIPLKEGWNRINYKFDLNYPSNPSYEILMGAGYGHYYYTAYIYKTHTIIDETGLKTFRGVIGNLTLLNGELYELGKYELLPSTNFDIQYVSSIKSKNLITFKPSKLELYESSFNISFDYINSSTYSSSTNVALSLLRYESGGWYTYEVINLDNTAGSHTGTFNHTFTKNETYKYRIALVTYPQVNDHTLTLNIVINNIRTFSVGKNAVWGVHKGSFEGTGTFENANIDTLAIGDYTFDSTGLYSDNETELDIRNYYAQLTLEATNGSSNYVHVAPDYLACEYNGYYYQINWTSSDERFKEDIEPLDIEVSKAIIDGTTPKKFAYKNNEGKHYGVLAQDMRPLLDDLGETDARLEHSMNIPNPTIDDPRTVDYQEFIPLIINYVKDLRAVVDRQQAEIDQLKEIVKKLSM